MELTQALIDEHVLILEGLGYLKLARDRIEKNQHPPVAFFKNAVPFFRNYADKYHHYKEEFLMFGFLAAKKEGLLDLEIGSLRHQHESGRGFLTRVDTSLKGYDAGNEIAVTSLLENLAAFCSVLSRHIFMEDRVFFPMVEKELSPTEKNTLLEQFRLEEQALETRNPVEKNLELLNEMQRLIGGTYNDD
ncbi:MAG: hemerythrin domain-containing protein [Desulfobacterales bacterium]|nr:hemerythrin domain-containing protein [Desulfobacterales bacterium]